MLPTDFPRIHTPRKTSSPLPGFPLTCGGQRPEEQEDEEDEEGGGAAGPGRRHGGGAGSGAEPSCLPARLATLPGCPAPSGAGPGGAGRGRHRPASAVSCPRAQPPPPQTAAASPPTPAPRGIKPRRERGCGVGAEKPRWLNSDRGSLCSVDVRAQGGPRNALGAGSFPPPPATPPQRARSLLPPRPAFGGKHAGKQKSFNAQSEVSFCG